MLRVGVDGHVLDAGDTLAVHACHGVGPTATYADDADLRHPDGLLDGAGGLHGWECGCDGDVSDRQRVLVMLRWGAPGPVVRPGEQLLSTFQNAHEPDPCPRRDLRGPQQPLLQHHQVLVGHVQVSRHLHQAQA